MQEIRCPNCGDVIPIDESAYSRIVLQIRDQEFNQEVQRYKREEAQHHAEELERLEQEYTERLARADELAQMRADEKYRKQLAAQETQLHRMELEAAAQSDKTQLQVQSALLGKREELAKKDITITELSGRLALQESEQTMREQAIRSEYELKLKEKDAEISYYKDFKARQSTKMIGESLEQHCEIEFNRLRPTAFRNAYFEKDNDARTGSKGDYIYRETSEEGVEIISIMFEMKNEMDTTATKHKNEDFFKELDKDRREKKCEYAVLVSLLEAAQAKKYS